MLQASVASVTSAADTAVGDSITNHANILNREIRTKSLNLDSQGTATKNFIMGEQYHIVGLPDPTVDHEAVNLRTLNREIRANNLLKVQKYLRLDGENQMVSDFRMNDHKLVGLAQWFPNCGPWPSTRSPRHFQWATEAFGQILLFCYIVDIMRFVLKKVIICKTIII